jgi:hypothetical protein
VPKTKHVDEGVEPSVLIADDDDDTVESVIGMECPGF